MLPPPLKGAGTGKPSSGYNTFSHNLDAAASVLVAGFWWDLGYPIVNKCKPLFCLLASPRNPDKCCSISDTLSLDNSFQPLNILDCILWLLSTPISGPPNHVCPNINSSLKILRYCQRFISKLKEQYPVIRRMLCNIDRSGDSLLPLAQIIKCQPIHR